MHRITVDPGGLIIHAQADTPFRELLLREGLLVDFPCGGRGLCNQCRIRIAPPTESGRGGRNPLPEEEVGRGVRLACRAVVEGDCTVTLPEREERIEGWEEDTPVAGMERLYGESLVKRRSLALARPALEDQRADLERVAEALGEARIPTQASSLEAISATLRQNAFRVDALLEGPELLCVTAAEEPVYGFAVDLGTTTVDLALYNLETGRQIGRQILLNRQTAYGADVISRVQHFQESRSEVRAAATETIAAAAEQLLEQTRVRAEQVVRTVVVGNPIMIHILHDLNPRQLTLAPYIPVVSGLVRRPPQEFGWGFQRHGSVESLPLISAFVGADTMGMILALDLEHESEVSLSIDIGTNGEMVLARKGELITTSTAAGPAFEGAQISCGMRALKGAITGVKISRGGEVRLEVMGGGAPRGICGSGLIAGTAALLEVGVVDSTGRLLAREELEETGLKERLSDRDGFKVFDLDPEGRVFISQKDIRELQLAKGAIRTGIEMLLAETGISVSELTKIRLAGNFGSGVDIPSIIRMGLIPQVPEEVVDVVGNAALRGASLALVSKAYRERALSVHSHARFLELAARPDFQMRFAESMMF